MVPPSALVFGLAGHSCPLYVLKRVSSVLQLRRGKLEEGWDFWYRVLVSLPTGLQGELADEGVPAQYVPGNEYDISIASKDNLAHKLAISQGGGTITGENSQSTSCRYKSTVSKTSSYKWIAPQSGNAVAFFALCGRL